MLASFNGFSDFEKVFDEMHFDNFDDLLLLFCHQKVCVAVNIY